MVPDTCSFSFRWRYPGALGRLALSHRQGSASGKRSTQSRRVPTKLPPHQTRGGMSFNCQGTARAGRGLLHLVGTDSEDPRIEANLCERARSRPAFFSWTVHCAAVGGCAAYGCGIPPAGAARSLFGKTKREWGVECPAIIMAPAPSHRTAPPHASGKPAHRD